MECRCSTLPPLTWTQFHALFPEKYVPRTLRDHKKDEFMALEEGGMCVASYEASSMLYLDICYIVGYY